MKKKFFKLFAIFYILSLVLILLIVSYSIYNQILTSLNDYYQNLRFVDYSITSFFKRIEADLNILKNNPDVNIKYDEKFTFKCQNDKEYVYNISKEEQRIIDIFNQYRINNSYINSVYMGRENGSFVRSHKRDRPTKYDPRLRPWYILGKENREAVSRLATYKSVTNDDINIGNVTSLINEKNEIYGVIGIDVTLDNLSEFIGSIQLNYEGDIELINENRIVLVSSNSNNVNKTVDDNFYKQLGKNDRKFFYRGDFIYVHYKSPFEMGYNW